MADDGWRAGASVRIDGLKGAAQHNGKVGRLKGRVGEDRLGVELDDGVVLSIKRANLELVPPKPAAASSSGAPKPSESMEVHGLGGPGTLLEKNQRTLKREPGLLDEFHGSQDPDTLVLYHHLRDQAFDCFNATEYSVQMLQYYGAGLEVVEVVPRKLGADEYALVCLMDKKHVERNSLCSLAFQCQRQFCGISMLVKRRCFSCNKPGAPPCKCACFFFCDGCVAGQSQVRVQHTHLCDLICASKASVKAEEESVQLL